MSQKGMPSKAFFIPALVGLIIGGCIWFIIMFIFFLNGEWGKEALRFKESLFFSVSGQFEKIKPHEETNSAVNIGKYLKEEYKKGVSLRELIRKQKGLSRVFSALEKSKEKYLVEFLKDPTIINMPEGFIDMARDWRWRYLSDDENALKTLQSLIKGEGQAPKIDYDYESVFRKGDFFLLALIVQFWVFFCFLIYRKTDENYNTEKYHWHEVSWGKPGTYIVILLLLPGALPLLAIAGFVELCSMDFGEKFRERKEARQIRRESGFASLKKTSDAQEAEGRELLEKLRRKVEGGGNV